MKSKPDWLRIPYNENANNLFVNELLSELNINTVCDEADCPNRSECYSKKTATFMIMGTVCTRRCTFCNVRFGSPKPPDENEPERIAVAVRKLDLKYVVITSVTRDDLPDGGASKFADVVLSIRNHSPGTGVEILIPDLSDLTDIINVRPSVISHNIETVKSLYPFIRPEANYERSLSVLKNVKKADPNIHTKSGLMLGLGETQNEVIKVFENLLQVGCDFLTIGQYLSPSKKHFPVREYIDPQVFDEYGKTAKKMGFRHVVSAPLVRSSYNASLALYELNK